MKNLSKYQLQETKLKKIYNLKKKLIIWKQKMKIKKRKDLKWKSYIKIQKNKLIVGN